MGWGIEVPMYLSRVTKDGLQSEQEDTERLIQFLRRRIIAAVSYTNPTVHDGDQEWSLIEYASIEIPQILEELAECEVKLAMINVAIANTDKIIVDE